MDNPQDNNNVPNESPATSDPAPATPEQPAAHEESSAPAEQQPMTPSEPAAPAEPTGDDGAPKKGMNKVLQVQADTLFHSVKP